MHGLCSGDHHHPGPDRQQNQSRAKVRLLGNQQHWDPNMHQRSQNRPPLRDRRAVPGEKECQRADQDDFRKFGRLKLHRAQTDPPARPLGLMPAEVC